MIINVKIEDVRALRKLLKELDGYYEDPETPWNFDDVDAQRSIACEIATIIEPYIIKKKDA